VGVKGLNVSIVSAVVILCILNHSSAREPTRQNTCLMLATHGPRVPLQECYKLTGLNL